MVVDNEKDGETYLMIQTDLLTPTITGERLFEYCQRLYDERAAAIEKRTDYLKVREWAGYGGGTV